MAKNKEEKPSIVGAVAQLDARGRPRQFRPTVRRAVSEEAPKSAGMDAADWQERHSPTAPTEILMRGARQPIGVRRRLCDIRLWDGLDQPQQDALVEIDRAIHIIARGVGAKSPAYQPRIPGPESSAGMDAELLEDWMEWSRAIAGNQDAHRVIVALLVDGRSLNQIDGGRGWRHGTAREHLVYGLDAWCGVRKPTGKGIDRPRRYAWQAEGARDGGGLYEQAPADTVA